MGGSSASAPYPYFLRRRKDAKVSKDLFFDNAGADDALLHSANEYIGHTRENGYPAQFRRRPKLVSGVRGYDSSPLGLCGIKSPIFSSFVSDRKIMNHFVEISKTLRLSAFAG
jgi:hypothetical protein